MKKRQKINTKTGLMLLAVVAMLLVVVPANACAPGDQDCDGFTDFEEESDLLPLPSDLVHVNGSTYLDLQPGKKDSFVILVKPEGSNLDNIDDPFLYVNESGLNTHVHLLQCANSQTDCDRNLYGTELGQKAIMATEVLGGSQTLGRCDEEWCTPNAGLDNIKVFTDAIKKHIAETCAGYETCKSSTGEVGLLLEQKHYMHTLAHEWGHDNRLRKDNVQKVGGWHYDPREQLILSQYVTTRTGKTSVTWYIGTDWGRGDPVDVTLFDEFAAPL